MKNTYLRDEICLRCDCGVEHLDIDLWFTTNAADVRLKEAESRGGENDFYYDEGYLTVTQSYGDNVPWKERLKAAWTLLRGREHIFTSVILKPEDHQRLREFFSKTPDMSGVERPSRKGR